MSNQTELLLLGASTICCLLLYKLNKDVAKRKRTRWTRKWLQKRQGKGTLALLNKELKFEDPEGYRNFLRLDDNQFTELLNLVENDIKKEDTNMRDSISAKHRLNVTLRFLATGETYRSLMYSTRIHESTISKIVPETCKAIYSHLKDPYLKTPQTSDEWLRIARDYEYKWNFPNCVGALDGRHIAFSAPISAGSYYHNYKGTESIVLLGLVDANYKFTYVNVGVNGRVSDGGVFSACKLSQKMNDNSLGLPPPRVLPGRTNKVPYVFIADDAFPLSDNLMKPFPQRQLTYQHRIFNYRLSRARRMPECGFGILVNRWRVLMQKIHLSAEKVELITLTCVVLHNFLASKSTQYRETEGDANPVDLPIPQVVQQFGNRSRISARNIREEFTTFFNSPLGSVPWQDASVERGN